MTSTNTNATSRGNPMGSSGSKWKLPPMSSGPSITKRVRRTKEEARAETEDPEDSSCEERETRAQERARLAAKRSSNSVNIGAPTQGFLNSLSTAVTAAVAQGNLTGPVIQGGGLPNATFGDLLDRPRARNPHRRRAPGGVPFGMTLREERGELRGWRLKTYLPSGNDLLPPPRRMPCCSHAGEEPAGRPGIQPPSREPRGPLGLGSIESTHVGTRRTRGGPADIGGSRHASGSSSRNTVQNPSDSVPGDHTLSAETCTSGQKQKRKRVRFAEDVDAQVGPPTQMGRNTMNSTATTSEAGKQQKLKPIPATCLVSIGTETGKRVDRLRQKQPKAERRLESKQP
ncbi:hypothetical protein TWF281_001068 [Arthrobotrys megalospora]